MASGAAKQGHWLWNDPDHGGYTKFDGDTSQQLEIALQAAIDSGTKDKISVTLSKGDFFGSAKNKGLYVCKIDVDCSDKSNPVIHTALQVNTKTTYQRAITRRPPLNGKQSEGNLKASWQWKDDYGWKDYDADTTAGIEAAFEQKARKVDLKQGYFSKSPGVYYVEINYLSEPASGLQYNTKSRYARYVRRVPSLDETEPPADKELQYFLKRDPHFLWRKFYFPLSAEDFNDEKNDKEAKQILKCSICLGELAEGELLERQKSQKVAPKKKAYTTPPDAQSEDEKQAASAAADRADKHQPKFDLRKAKQWVTKETIVALNQCTFGHYFHAHCIQQSLDSKRACPQCTVAYGEIIGHQPDGRLFVTQVKNKCAGFEADKGSIKMLFEFPGGIQGDRDPNPGKMYFGDLREAFVPDNRDGREACILTRHAFKRKLLFHIGTSVTLNQENRIVFGSLHLKTKLNGGAHEHGWPDDNYFKNFKNELLVKGITPDILTDDEKTFVQDGWSKK